MLLEFVLVFCVCCVASCEDCVYTQLNADERPPNGVSFVDVSELIGLNGEKFKQSQIRTSPNCIFPQFDAKLQRWDTGGFCLEETLTGGACVGDFNNDSIPDLYYPRMDGTDILFQGNGTHFEDVTLDANLHTNETRGNGCVFFDIDNDGDLDLYVSTVGDTQFYLYVNDGDGIFSEESLSRGLDNRKPNKTLTAGFTLAVADYNNDGYLDVISTEWLPWLDEVSGVQCSVGETGPHCTVEINSIESAVSYFQQLSDRRSNNATVNMTNARLFRNLGRENPGHFVDDTLHSNVKQTYKSQSKRTEFMGGTCKRIPEEKLQESLDFLLESSLYRDPKGITTKMRFRKLMNFLSDSKSARRTMSLTKNRKDPADYLYLKAGGSLVKQEGTLTVLVQSAHETDFDKGVDIVVSGKENKQPTLSRGQYTWKSVARRGNALLNRLEIKVGGSYGLKTYYIGLKCNNPDGCAFDVYIYADVKDSAYENAGCVDGKADIVKYAGDFAVDLVSPWLKSEKFILHCVQEMKRLNISSLKGRQTVRKLLQAGKRLDLDRYDRMSNTSRRISSEMATLSPAQRNKEATNLREHQEGKRKMNHLLSFPLVGAFQFSAMWSDLNEDHHPDLIISGDFGTSEIFWNNGNGTFTTGFFDLVEDLLDNSMGATTGDWDADGKIDVMFTSTSISESDLRTLNEVAATAGMILSFRGNHLYRNIGNRLFEDVTEFVGIRESGWGWGAFFFDFDNDGDMDVLNGNGMDDPETTDDDWAAHQKMKLYVNQGAEGKFRMHDEAEMRGIASTAENRGAMTLDYDNDGDLDVLVINHASTPSFYRNDGGNYYDYLRVYVYEKSGRESIGAKVYLMSDSSPESSGGTEQIQEIGSQSAFLGQSQSAAHFGLGLRGTANTLHRIRVVWSATASKTFYNIPPRTTMHIHRDTSDEHASFNHSSEPLPKCRHVIGSTNEVTLMETASNTQVGKEDIVGLETLKKRYINAANFFKQKISRVDDILKEMKKRGIEDIASMRKLLKQKYPFL